MTQPPHQPNPGAIPPGHQPSYGGPPPGWGPPQQGPAVHPPQVYLPRPVAEPPTRPPARRGRWVLAAVAGVVAFAVVAVVAVRVWPGVVATTAPSPYATAIPSGRGGAVEPGQTVSIPPVPLPVPDQGTYDSPDRLDVPIPDVKPAGFLDPPAGSGTDRYLQQPLDWTPCVRNDVRAQCATVAVPLDHADPDGQAITLSLLKLPATKPKVGSLFVNPGGPGYGGTDLATRFTRDGLEMYDIVGWDPRGTGGSTPVQCENGAAMDRLMAMDATPDSPEEMTALQDAWKQFGLGCLERSGALLRHISTADTVADLDLLRQLVGDEKLSYLGYSYGTKIGSYYAERYPQHVGRMVLDSAVNITRDTSVVQAVGFDLALRNYAEWCVRQRCSLGGETAEANLKVVTDLFDRLDRQPLQVGSRQLTQNQAVDAVLLFMYFDESTFANLTTRIMAAQRGNGAPLLEAADQFRDRGRDGTYATSFFGLVAINCLDAHDGGLGRAVTQWEKDRALAPIFGTYLGPGFSCEQWPVRPVPEVSVDGDGAAPVVVIGSTGDSATPYRYAVWMAAQLASGVLVTYDGAGHATYGNDRSTCVDEAVVRYLADGVVPPYGLLCTS